MTDAANPESDQAATPAAPPPGPPMIRVLAQYIKDLSFENPGLFAGQNAGSAPEIELGIDVRVEPGPPAEHLAKPVRQAAGPGQVVKVFLSRARPTRHRSSQKAQTITSVEWALASNA